MALGTRSPVPILCLTGTHIALGPVGSRLARVGSRWSCLGWADFNYINRVADCLGVDLEPGMKR